VLHLRSPIKGKIEVKFGKRVVNDVWHERIHENVIDYLILNLKEKRREVNREWSGAR
jgi:hypothetical protein